MIRPSTLLRLYRARLRVQPWHELFALVGIASGVGLVFAVLVANASLAGSIEQLVRAIMGNATIEVAARSDHGLDQQIVDAVADVDGVDVAAPILERRVTLRGPDGERTVLLIGATYELARLDGPVTQALGAGSVRLTRALFLTRSAAASIGVRPGERAMLQTGGRTRPVKVALALDRTLIGSLAESPVAVTQLAYVQDLADRPARVTRVVVKPKAGASDAVRDRLEQRFGTVANVRPSDSEAQLIRQAAGPNDRSTGLFAAIAGGVGVLFALVAVLLAAPARRQLLASLRMQGFSPGQLVALVIVEALLLGVVASALGLLLGDLLSRHVFSTQPGYLSFAFPVGGQRVVEFWTIAAAIGAGLIGSLAAAIYPLAGALARPRSGAATQRRQARGRTAAALAGGLLLAVTIVVSLAAPALALVGIGALVVAMLLLLPQVMRAVSIGVRRAAGRLPWASALIAAGELRAAPARAGALAATAALAVCATTAIEGAHRDLLRGLDAASRDLTHTSDVWILPTAEAENTLATTDFTTPAATLARLANAPEIAAVRAYHGAFLDVAGRRLWVIARPSADRPTIPADQVLDGDQARAEQRIRAGGWTAISKQAADELDVDVGDIVTLPTPTGQQRLRLAATLSNVGWAPGTIIMNARDYRRGWNTTDPAALEIDLTAGVSPTAGAATARAIVSQTGAPLTVRTAGQRWEQMRTNARQGLNRLTQIATLLIIAAIMATIAAVTTTVWQRRGMLAQLRAQGWTAGQVWRTLVAEAAVVLATGCLIGALVGLAGQALLTRWLLVSTGFPADYTPALPLAATLLALIGVIALTVIAVPGAIAARAPLRLSFREE